MNSYELMRPFWDWAYDNPEKIKPVHIAVFHFAIEHCNRMGWKQKFGFPSQMTMEAIGVKSYKTYINALSDLVDWGFIIMIERSKNQYSANIIELVKYTKANTKALDKALPKHGLKQVQSTDQSIASIDKPINNKTIKRINKAFAPPSLIEVQEYCKERKNSVNAETFIDFYASKGWMVGKTKMKDWQASIRTWEKRETNGHQKNSGSNKTAATSFNNEREKYDY